MCLSLRICRGVCHKHKRSALETVTHIQSHWPNLFNRIIFPTRCPQKVSVDDSCDNSGRLHWHKWTSDKCIQRWQNYIYPGKIYQVVFKSPRITENHGESFTIDVRRLAQWQLRLKHESSFAFPARHIRRQTSRRARVSEYLSPCWAVAYVEALKPKLTVTGLPAMPNTKSMSAIMPQLAWIIAMDGFMHPLSVYG